MENILNRELSVNKTVKLAVGTVSFVLFIALGALVRIPLPFSPVPVTLQTFFVLLAGAFLGARLGALAICGYILLGISGIPLFTLGGSGLLYLAGPTAGYLLGFLLAGVICGVWAVRLKKTAAVFLLFCLAGTVVLLCGVLWLRLVFRLDASRAFLAGFFPFIPGDLLKALSAALVYSRLRNRSR